MTFGRIGRIAPFALAACLSAGVLAVRARLGVETDLYGLLDAGRGGFLRELAASRAGEARILLESDDPVALASATGLIRRRLSLPPAESIAETVRGLSPYVSGLIAPDTRALLIKGGFARVAEEARARLFGPVPPVFPVRDDPFLLASGFAMELGRGPADGWTFEDGCPTRRMSGRTFRLLQADLSRHGPDDLAAFLDEMESRPASEPVKVWCAGAPFHAARAARRAKGEIAVLSWISLAGVLFLGWRLFGSWRFVPGLLAAVGFAGLMAAGALFAAYPRPHVLSFVFGTSLIGLSVDYAYHAGCSGNRRSTLRPLASALVTTAACFVPLFFSSAVVLGQMALFTVSGLVAAYGWVVAFGMPRCGNCRGDDGADSPATRTPRIGRAVWALALLSCAGLPRLRLSCDPSAFYRPDGFLLAGERKCLELLPSQRFAFVRGPSVQEALEREEEAGLGGLSSRIPSLKRQRENLRLKERLVAAEGAGHTALTGLKMPVGKGEEPALLDPERCPVPMIRRILESARVGDGIIAPCPESFAGAPGVVPLDPKAGLAEIFRNITAETVRWLEAGGVLFALLALVCIRRGRLRCVASVVVAVGATAGLLGWMGIPVTFFTLLCFFVIAGLGIDYAIFSQDDPSPGRRRVVRYSFLTSLVGFGTLAFTAFPVTRDMGCVLAPGLFFSYLLAGAWRRRESDSGSSPWYRQRERGAGRWRLAAMWWLYVAFGKGVLKAIAVPVLACAYPGLGGVRRALRGFYAAVDEFRGRPSGRISHARLFRHLLGFAWALADKTDVATRRRHLPLVTVRDDPSWRDFQADLSAGRGAFLLASHLGTAEMLAALPDSLGVKAPHLHAFQLLRYDAVFTGFLLRHFKADGFTLRAVEEIGVETASEMQDAIRRGELVLMAGDRASPGSGKTLSHPFLGRPCEWPKGAFVFARLMESPVYFVTCVRTGRERWEAHFRRFDSAPAAFHLRDLLAAYASFLEEEVLAHPDQWHHFHDFFTNSRI